MDCGTPRSVKEQNSTVWLTRFLLGMAPGRWLWTNTEMCYSIVEGEIGKNLWDGGMR